MGIKKGFAKKDPSRTSVYVVRQNSRRLEFLRFLVGDLFEDALLFGVVVLLHFLSTTRCSYLI